MFLYFSVILYRLTWQRIRAMQMFLEHVLVKHHEVPAIVAYARRLDYVSLSHHIPFGW